MRPCVLAAVLLAGCAANGEGTGNARLDAQIAWVGGSAAHGGLSAILLDDAGSALVAVSDRGMFFEAALERDAEGRLVGVRDTERRRAMDPDGTGLFGGGGDMEGIAPLPDGFVVSLEGRNALWRFSEPGARPTALRVPEAFASIQDNSGIEALASDAAGTLYAIPERSGDEARPFPVYRLRDGVWDTELAVPRDPPFLPTGADIGPDGRLYVVERHFTGFSFSIRVRSFAIGADLDEMRTDVPPRGDLDNAEGIDVWRDGDGQLRLTLISDDNFFPLQRTLISEFVLPATP